MEITTAGLGPALLRAQPHPPPWTYLIILCLRNHRIGLWVVLLLNQSTCQEMHPEVSASFPMMWCEAGSSSKQSSLHHARQAGCPEQCQEAGCFDPAPGYAWDEFSSAQHWIRHATQQRGSVQLPAAADTSKGIST